ncbi:MAG: helix-turn-helix domain-containing protein [Lachnospiraceae bacterium]|nr:helix-turn-helix domain-containing protein [Lachnospiraceae bacterium]
MGKFANVLKELRIKSGLTQQEMADKLNISRSSIGMYENGEREPSFELLELIADYFNVDMNYLLGKKESSENIPQGYYLNEDARNMAQFLYENPEYKVLFDATRKVKKEDILFVKEMIDRMNNEK